MLFGGGVMAWCEREDVACASGAGRHDPPGGLTSSLAGAYVHAHAYACRRWGGSA